MRLRFLLFVLLCVVHQGMLEAKAKEVKINAEKWKGVERSLSGVPIISHDRNIIYVYSCLPLQDIEVTISNASGEVVYAERLSIGANQAISFTFDDLDDGAYLIEVSHGRKYLYGWFELE